ncbi:MAG TPA: class F sortase [Patescibacteria group bacterium]|nr:class F sortase [Patescibacteria group bacterium]
MKKYLILTLVLISICCLGSGGFILLRTHHSAAQRSKPTAGAAKAMTSSSQKAIEIAPTPAEINSHSVPPTDPRYISIAKLGIQKARVAPMSITTEGSIQAPTNIYDAGWYADSAKPGQPGAMFIDGHIAGPHNTGIFAGLTQLAAGDTITVEKGDGTVLTYAVDYVEQVPADSVDMHKALAPYNADKQSLNLMTCGGTFDNQTNQYQNRIVVYASRT